jgi:hypothetical protein
VKPHGNGWGTFKLFALKLANRLSEYTILS